ncbi:MAG: bifunctional phosphopantothenoylcysteine decarboxylase/phosphopantothenate--cysteine ligase CoaBC [Thermoplasmata archaeon]|nr:bifunctional phosphopantothenoylcysteine decarboxylase/phosphopantothenate--cysteine ligase CoaBC [Thermoplasmata archaeon]MCI4344833.1 bifunctional phosphopantothenoylcysteine decarboxylase/phosphopantothenate--cysteine ligase CoaBC [Thermoplasmata archaeon]
MHPSRAIRGRTSQLLSGKTIVIGISGSIAAVETPRIVRELIRHGADVQAVMTPDAARIVTPEAIHFATGHAPVTELTGGVEHVTWFGPGEGRADLLLLAPATANTISKVAHGIDDTAVTSFASVALGGGVPVLVAPAMHADMERNPAIRENLERLRGWGVGVIAPTDAEGEAKLGSPEEIAAAVLHRLVRGSWAGRGVVVIGGASREAIDEVRSVTNESSGETAVSLAAQSYYRGAEVELWLGNAQYPVPSFLRVQRWRSLEDLRSLVRTHGSTLARAAAVFVPAALSDYTLTPRHGKISSREHPTLTLELRPAPKLLPELRRRAPRPTRLIGFKLEATTDPAAFTAEAERLLRENDLDWTVANDRSAMGASTTRVLVLSARGTRHTLEGPKFDVAGKLLDDLGRDLSHLRPAVAPTAGSSPRDRPKHRGRRSRALSNR